MSWVKLGNIENIDNMDLLKATLFAGTHFCCQMYFAPFAGFPQRLSPQLNSNPKKTSLRRSCNISSSRSCWLHTFRPLHLPLFLDKFAAPHQKPNRQHTKQILESILLSSAAPCSAALSTNDLHLFSAVFLFATRYVR